MITSIANPKSARSRQYDLVLNGNEVGGGIAPKPPDGVQKRVFKLLGISDEEAELKFSFLLRALSMGAPPHGGIAFGLDRLVMLFGRGGVAARRDRFPQGAGRGRFSDRAPTEATAAELKLYGLTVVSKPDDMR